MLQLLQCVAQCDSYNHSCSQSLDYTTYKHDSIYLCDPYECDVKVTLVSYNILNIVYNCVV